PSLVLPVVNGEHGWYCCQLITKSMTMPDHKRYQAGMMIMAMNHVGIMLPFAEPITESYLKSDETFIIVVVAVYFFAIEESIDIDKIKIEAKFVGLFANNTVMKPL